ncbi:hypothetical protein HYC85_019000 [Camellia sinensis]|uniref:Uncharacterized protein n=1 Tax=Camellia sinensis TaxID=4442 RepID=A0A7J7GVW3_CAMSI|nr:hypothetical protein HYC85_019000 [Camellia sinensis]
MLEMFQYLGSANTLELFVEHHVPHNVYTPHPVLFLTDVPVNDVENAQHPQSHDYEDKANSEDKENDDSPDSDFLASSEGEDDPTDDDIMFDGNVEREPNGE